MLRLCFFTRSWDPHFCGPSPGPFPGPVSSLFMHPSPLPSLAALGLLVGPYKNAPLFSLLLWHSMLLRRLSSHVCYARRVLCICSEYAQMLRHYFRSVTAPSHQLIIKPDSVRPAVDLLTDHSAITRKVISSGIEHAQSSNVLCSFESQTY